MTINTQSYLRAAYPLARSTGQQTPRLFTLHWDNHKQRGRRRDKDDWFECWGTLYPSGTITLENGMFYQTRSQMEAAYRAMGDYRLTFADEQEAAHE